MECHSVEVINLDKCKQLMADFIQLRLEIWYEDIGC